MTELAQWMKDVKEGVDARLNSYFDAKEAEARTISPDSVELVDGIRSLTMRGGKRFRPMMVEAGYRAVAPEGPEQAAIDAGAGLEILQSYLLIHDDWMDQDEERRGLPAVHMMYRERYDGHLADSLAILAGDLACAYSQELVLGSDFGARLAQGVEIFMRIQKEVILGQHLDCTANADVARMHDLKTTSYTVRGPLLLGACLAGATEAQASALSTYAGPLGESFQLADDLLGTFGDMGKTGKPGNDLRNGKRTSLVGEAERLLAPGERDALDRVMAGEQAEEVIAAAAELLITSGARANVEARLRARSEEAKAVLSDTPLDENTKEILRGLADRLALRAV